MEIDYTHLPIYLQEVGKYFWQYQKTASTFQDDHPHSILDSPGGTGKTLITLRSVLAAKPKRVLVICAFSNALYTWQKELLKWFPTLGTPEHYTVIDGSPTGRTFQWKRDTLFNVLTFSMFLADFETIRSIRFDAIIIDEYDRTGLRKRDTKAHTYLKALNYVPKIHLISGSPIRRGPKDFWAPLNALAPKVFTSYWAFVNKFHYVFDGMFGKEITAPRNTEEFAHTVAPYIHVVPKREADAARPQLLRNITPLRMTSKQAKHYNNLANDMYTEIEDGTLKVVGLAMTRMLVFRQLLTCPRILGIDDDGAAIQLIADKLKETQNDRTVIFTPFTEAIPHYGAYLSKQFPNLNIRTLQGGDAKYIPERTEAFRKSGGIMLCSVGFAQSYELESSPDCHFPGYDWDQNNNAQCEWRIQRLTSDIHIPKQAFYYKHINTVDERVLEVLNNNAHHVKITYENMQQIQTLINPNQESEYST